MILGSEVPPDARGVHRPMRRIVVASTAEPSSPITHSPSQLIAVLKPEIRSE